MRRSRAPVDREERRRGEAGQRPPACPTSEEAVLALQQGAGNAAVSRMLARAPAPRAVEQPGHEEAGWMRPSTRMSDEPVHVATIHFRTKDWMIDAADMALLKRLAAAYAPYAARNRFKPKEPQGLRGSVVGYADARPSVAPSNRELSAKRADWTAHFLVRHLVQESGVMTGYFDIDRVAGGVAPEAGGGGAEQGPVAEGNVLAPNRRADILLSGQAVEPQPDAPKQPDAEPEDERVKPPDLDDWNTDAWKHNDWGKFDKPIEAADKREIHAMAARMGGVLATQGNDIDTMLFWVHQAGGVTGHAIPKLRLRKPPWWDNRDAGIYPKVGRGGMTAQQKLTYKAKLLRRDYIEAMKWAEMHVTAPGSSLKQMIDEVKKDRPDPAKLEQWAVALGQLRFMLDETQKLAEEVLKMTG